MIKLKGIKKIYENKVIALNGIHLEVEQGEMLGVMGVSGSGKSTLINIIGGIDTPSEGSYYLRGENVAEMNHIKLARLRNRYFGFIVQHFALIDDYSVKQNIKVPLDYNKLKNKEKKRRIWEMMEKLRIEDKADNFPDELSGGECQRVAIARALVNQPEVILADEPTGEVDYETGVEIMNLFRQLINEKGITVCVATHDPAAMEFGDIVFEIIDGKLSQKE